MCQEKNERERDVERGGGHGYNYLNKVRGQQPCRLLDKALLGDSVMDFANPPFSTNMVAW